MTEHDYGPLATFEVTWNSGVTELVQGHQVMMPGAWSFRSDGGEKRITIHGSFGGHWRLVLSALDSDIQVIRNITDGTVVSEAP